MGFMYVTSRSSGSLGAPYVNYNSHKCTSEMSEAGCEETDDFMRHGAPQWGRGMGLTQHSKNLKGQKAVNEAAKQWD